ncbi:polyhydroxyalkanoate depolymerase [Pacificimonas flava]|uniref:Polyhydroxyalkanoate depolymerase n=2 Tax=Pacificimonas TaxID=1960290 RepID=A0A219B7U2_9SPHN|nr:MULTISPECIES: polyhydroxyalkanoate depolymerase [Pacificimonas]MBZ6379922.1 polyhydroxyalkanoate depolymerase [Pacificimonas aurantium]OWV34445.1 polyhydroxyalkanoate depolymerase [Pacificimonas flava]
MLYSAYEMQRAMLAGAGATAQMTANMLTNPANPFAYFGGGLVLASALDVFAHAAEPRGKPPFGLEQVEWDGKTYEVTEETALQLPFGQLKRFVKKDGGNKGQPRVLIVAPMSGHFATLLRGTVERMIPLHDVYVTDWRDAKLVPLSEGSFDLDDYIDYVIQFLETIGAGAHVIAVCQPSVPVYAAVALMSGQKNEALPATVTLMGGPIDTRECPTSVNGMATNKPHAWFEQNAIATVPAYYPGAMRQVYPGFMQLGGFMSMNLGDHMMSHWEMFKHLIEGDEDSAERIKIFYDEYRSVCDMTAEFYLQTVDVVFQRHLLPKGQMTHRGKPVDPSAITGVALLAVEGERDDISGIGQTKAALTLAKNLPDEKKKYYMAEGVGHYGIFNGSKWRTQIAPVVEEFIRTHGS